VFDNNVVFESYGVRVRLEADDPELLKEAERVAHKALLNTTKIFESENFEQTFGFAADDEGNLHLFQNGAEIADDKSRPRFFKFFNSMLRIAVAEHAQGKVFIHAGVVGWRGKAIVIPANSFHGKTTLVAALVKRGAAYYSDEYAVLDEDGLVHAFPRELSVRDSEYREKDVPVEELGGEIGSEPIPVGLVLLTEYREGATWKPERLTAGQGMLEVIPHTIPRNYNAEFSLKVLNTAMRDVIILKMFRGEADEFAIKILSYFDNILLI
jgi:hypothetical protein